jgi:hypothetical protein
MNNTQGNQNQGGRQDEQQDGDGTSTGMERKPDVRSPGQQQAQEDRSDRRRSNTNIETDTDNDDGDKRRDPTTGDGDSTSSQK